MDPQIEAVESERNGKGGQIMETSNDLVETVRRYFEAIGSGDLEDNLKFFSPDVIQEEFPNRLIPEGATRNLESLREAAERGQKVIRKQRIEMLNAVANGNKVAVEAQWTGVLAVPFGSIPEGGTMSARFAIFLEFRDGLIIRQHNYDCFDPF